jgi:hypothetical protein
MRLYAHQRGAISDLEAHCRVNPDFTSGFRNDLEFFIPQIGSFFLKGESQHPEELLQLIIHASGVDFYFAHRIWFFCQSVMFQSIDSETLTKSRQILKALAKKVLDQDKTCELLYLANSKDIMELLGELNLRDYYPALSLFENPNHVHHN